MIKTPMILKDNSLINASYSLGVAEQRLIFLAIIEAREKQTVIEAGGMLRITAKKYAEHFKVESHTAYEALKRAADALYDASFRYSKKDEETGAIGEYKRRWLEEGGYIAKLGCVEIMFSSWVVPLITRLESCYTAYELKQVSGLTSEYAIRIYEIAIQWRSVGKTPTIKLDELRGMLGLTTEYTRMEAFKRRVLDKAVEQINKHTDIDVKYNQHKEGSRIVGFSFNFKQKPEAKKSVEKNTSCNKNNKKQIRFEDLSPAQLTRVTLSPKFISDYNHMISPNSPANQEQTAWVNEFVSRIKKDSHLFSKRPLEEYLNK